MLTSVVNAEPIAIACVHADRNYAERDGGSETACLPA